MSRKYRGARATICACSTLAIVATACTADLDPPPLEPLEGAHVFVASGVDGRVHVFDESTFEEVATVEVGAGASEVHSTPDGSIVWALATDAAQVALIDASTLDVRIVPVGLRPVHSYLDPSGRIWIGNDGSSDVSIVDVEAATETRVLTGNGHHKMAFVTDGAGALAFAYVSNINDSNVTVIDPEGAVVEQVQVGRSPHGMTYSRVTERVYNCSGDEQNSLEVLEPFAADPHAVVARIPLTAGRCAWIRGGDEHGWMGLSSAGTIARITFATHAIESWAAGPSPDAVAIVRDRAYVASATEPIVTVVDLAGGARRTIAVGRGNSGIRHHAGRIYVPHDLDGAVSVIDVESEAVIATLTGINRAKGIAVANGGAGTPPE